MGSHQLAEPFPTFTKAKQRTAPIVIVGNGPVGIKAAQLLLAKSIDSKIVLFGEERESPYNRVQLSLFLAGKVSESELDNPVLFKQHPGLEERRGRKIIAIDRANKTVTDSFGEITYYSKLILALGSTPVTPGFDNIYIDGVHQFRTLADTKCLIARREACKSFFVVGCGPLGLETAMAMKQPNNQVNLIVRSRMLTQDMGERAQQILMDHVEASGINIVYQNPIKRIIGKNKVEKIELANGELVDCDCLIFCVGVKPTIGIADQAKLETRKGIIVDEFMRTTDDDIYAVGECCEFDDVTYGIVSPGFSQAKTCVEHILGCFLKYRNESCHVEVKFGDYPTGYYGELLADEENCYRYTNRLKGIYRKLIIKNNRLVGAIVIGPWDEEEDVKYGVKKKQKVGIKALKEFEEEGFIYGKQPEQKHVKSLPHDYIICLCEGVTRGELTTAIQSGCRTVDTLGERTCAGTVCGSCKPLLMELLDEPAPNLVMRHQKSVLIASVVSILFIFVTVFFQPLSIADTVQFSWHIEKLWFDNFWKQVSGYSLLSLCALATALAIRKRWKKLKFGHVDSWRYAHSIVGILALIVLMIHTGMRLGENLNFALMSIFLGATLTGSLVGVFMARNHHWSDFKLRKHRLWWSRVHHTLLWMLLPLLGFHILSVYYF